MSKKTLFCLILAAGKGRRMDSSLPKPMHLVAGYPILGHIIDTVTEFFNNFCQKKYDGRLVVIAPPDCPEIEALTSSHQIVVQQEAKGTGHAALVGVENLNACKDDDIILVIYADTALISEKTLGLLVEKALENRLAILGFLPPSPKGYGRLKCDQAGHVERIIEHKDASEEEKKIELCNSGCCAAVASDIKKWLKDCHQNNAGAEYYLTDIVAIARKNGVQCGIVEAEYQEALGANNRTEIAIIEKLWQKKRRLKAMNQEQASLIDPDTVWFSYDTKLARDVVVEPCVMFGANVTIAQGVRIRAFSYIEDSSIADKSQIGPFARLRPGNKIDKNVKIGNFVEVKNASIGEGCKINHLTYIGDASLGKTVNIGAGVITCNYDGIGKHHTVIEDNVFIGSNVSMIAPLSLGKGALIAAGSVLTHDIEEDALAVSRPLLKQHRATASRVRKKMGLRKAKKE